MTTTEHSFDIAPQLAGNLKKYQHTSAFVGLIFLVLTVAGIFLPGGGMQQFLRSYLVGFWLWMGAGAGCLILVMTQYLTGGAWGVVIRRPLEAGSRTLYLFWLLFLPLLLGASTLYKWIGMQSEPVIQAKSLYLNVPFLWIRWVIYGIVWLGCTYFINKWSVREDETKSTRYSILLEKLSGPGVVFMFFTMTFCAIDYLMVLEPRWFSTVYGFMIIMGQCLTAMAIAIAVLSVLSAFAPMDHAVTKRHLHDLGKLLLALVMLWAYMNFAQLLITWSGNLPEEVVWYIKRWNGGWGWVGLILLIGHFCLPFLLLLSQDLKKNPKTIFWICAYLVLVHAVDVFTLVEPNFQNPEHVHFFLSWLDVTSVLGFGGLWFAMFFYFLSQRPLLPVGAPDLLKALNHGRSH
jgi:hypothetical protein